jgi:hypothetical protein
MVECIILERKKVDYWKEIVDDRLVHHRHQSMIRHRISYQVLNYHVFRLVVVVRHHRHIDQRLMYVVVHLLVEEKQHDHLKSCWIIEIQLKKIK